MPYHKRSSLLSQIIVPLVRNSAAVARLKRSLLLAARIRERALITPRSIAWTTPPTLWEPPRDLPWTRDALGGAR